MKSSINEIAYLMKQQILKYKIDDNGCWIHKNKAQKNGYVVLTRKRNNIYSKYYAHRLSFVLFKGEIPEGLLVCHTCDVRNCINPDHLFLGTYLDNNEDRFKKGRRGNYINDLDEEDIEMIKIFREQGLTQKKIAKFIGVSQSSISRHSKDID